MWEDRTTEARVPDGHSCSFLIWPMLQGWFVFSLWLLRLRGTSLLHHMLPLLRPMSPVTVVAQIVHVPLWAVQLEVPATLETVTSGAL